MVRNTRKPSVRDGGTVGRPRQNVGSGDRATTKVSATRGAAALALVCFPSSAAARHESRVLSSLSPASGASRTSRGELNNNGQKVYGIWIRPDDDQPDEPVVGEVGQ